MNLTTCVANAMMALGLLALLAACSPSGPSLEYGVSEKVCQLTGERDWATGKPPRPFPSSFFGLGGTDLGYPVEHHGRLAILFGDTRALPPLPLHGELAPPDDAVGWITSRKAPTAEECTDLVPNHDVVRVELPLQQHVDVRILKSPHVFSEIPQGIFDVPSGGVSNENWLYGFFWTNHCTNRLANDPCPETTMLNSTGRGVLARSNDDGRTFIEAVAMPRGFVYSTAVDAVATDGVPSGQKLGTFIFGVPKYRASVPYLALARPGSLHDPAQWVFYTGKHENGQPVWVSSAAWQLVRERKKPWHPPGTPELFGTQKEDRCIGEFSITWNQGLGVWLMLYNCGRPDGPPGIEARIADAPWGPWSDRVTILADDRDKAFCNYLMLPGDPRCAGRTDDWQEPDLKRGALYAPFVLERYTKREASGDARARKVTIYWLVSTWNPYQVIVMRTPLTVFRPLLSVKANEAAPQIGKN